MRENLWNNPRPDASSACLQVLKDLECCLAVGWLETTWKTCFRRMCLVMSSACGEPNKLPADVQTPDRGGAY